MGASGSAGAEGKEVPANLGEDYGREIIESTTDAESIFDLGTETTSIIVRAHPDNDDRLFIGFDDEVDSNSGFVLEPGDTIGVGIDVSQQDIYAIANTANDELRFMAVN